VILPSVVLWAAVTVAPAIPVEYRDCSAAWQDGVRRILDIELRSALRIDVAPLTASVTCTPDTSLAQVRVASSLNGKVVERTVDCSALGKGASARLLALNIAELVAVVVRTEEEPSTAVEPPAIASEAAEAPQTVRLLAVGLGEGFFQGTGLLAGGGARFVHQPSVLGWGLGLYAEHGSAALSLGRVQVDAFSGDLLAMLRAQGSTIGGFLGLGARAGAVRFIGVPSDPTAVGALTLWSFWGGPAAAGGLTFNLGPRLIAELRLQGGVAFAQFGARVARQPVYLAGPWVGLDAGLGLRL
jgi:hypothetical protein